MRIRLHDSGPTDAPVMVLGHALGVDSRIWDDVAVLIHDHYRVIRWDQPGHGESDRLGGVTDITAVADALLGSLSSIGVEQFHIAGISLGGMVSIAVAARAPQRALSLSVLDAGPSLLPADAWHDRARLVREEGMAALVEATMTRWFTTEYSGAGRATTVTSFLSCDPEGYAQCCELIAQTDLTPQLSDLSMPTLLMTGRDDPGMTPAQLDALAESIPHARLAVIEVARHLTCVEQPQAVAQVLLSQQEGARAA